jgi:flagellar P-ring protein precursor FlgI
MAAAVIAKFPGTAMAGDPATVRVSVPPDRRANLMGFIAEVETLDFQLSRVARVVLNEKTGTVIAGGEVTLSEVAVAHGSITVEIRRTEETQLQTGAAPGAVTQQSATNIREDLRLTEPKAELRVVPATASVADLARSLNSLGVSPRDVIAIFSAIKKAGALNAELVVM